MVLVLKTELNGDLRRIPLHNDFLTFDELHLMLCRVYSCDIGRVIPRFTAISNNRFCKIILMITHSR